MLDLTTRLKCLSFRNKDFFFFYLSIIELKCLLYIKSQSDYNNKSVNRSYTVYIINLVNL